MKLPTLLLILLLAAGGTARADEPAPAVAFNREIRPILSDNCFQCHGPDSNALQAELRLDRRALAVADRGGYAAIVPGDAQASALIDRITTDDPDLRMPPSDSNKQLTARDIQLLRAWIDQGAAYEQHWAFAPLQKPAIPDSTHAQAANPIDAFVSTRLHKHGLQLADEAAPETLLRRVTLDLTGLPPTPTELDAFLLDLDRPAADPDACYERVVDRLLGSPHFGEHLAVAWLDAARYADTNGYFGDKPRQMWLWRDWVIDAFNANMPYDQFTIEQLAGDLLPNATIAQRIATGFNRNHMANNETGIIDEEFRTEYVADRVHTTMTAWLGLSAGCAQCHDHKFDPISQREFYQLFAFFNNVPETGLIHADNPPPLLEVPSPRQERQRTELAEERRKASAAFEPLKKQLAPKLSHWEQSAPGTLPHPPGHGLVLHESFDGHLGPRASSIGTTLTFEPGVRDQAADFDATRHVEVPLPDFNPDRPWTIGFWWKPDGSLSCPLSLIEPTGNRRGLEVLFSKGRLSVHLVHRWGVSLIEAATTETISSKTWHHVVLTYDGSRSANGLRAIVDGTSNPLDILQDTLQGTIANSEPLRIGRRDSGLGCYGRLDELRILQHAVDGHAAADWYWGERLRGILAVSRQDRAARDSETLLDYYIDRFADSPTRHARDRLKQALQAEQTLRASIPTVLIMQEMDEPRVTHILERGEYDKPGDTVQPGVPAALAPWPAGEPRNRLGFARWLVSAENPLTPRVAVNHLWRHCFGRGLVRTVDDFGSQGEPPTHPQLLDWLAFTFRESGWDVKCMLRLIVTSRTYRQNSRFHVDGSQVVDPANRLLARGPSSRLSAEMLRDQALALSGLLVPRLGGPGVKPYQPPGLWEAVSYNGEETYVPDLGPGLWRRSVYTYIKRQAPPPSLLIFDGPTREKCTMHRTPTNTPLQALVLLNDDTYVEAARALAARARRSGKTDDARLRFLWKTVLLRDPLPSQLPLLRGLLNRQRERFNEDPAAAHQLLQVGASPTDAFADPAELAAWTVLAQTILNLDEALTKR